MYVITGINSGLGKYLYQNLPSSIGINRKNKESLRFQIPSNATILHCAFNSKRDLKNYSLYVEDNYLLTKELLELKNIKKFIYFSSIDIYGPTTPYSFMKRCAEDLIINSNIPHSILRISGPLGPTIRKNSLTRLLLNEQLTLHKDSLFNYILQEDILKSLNTFSELNGIYNYYCSKNITLGEIAKELSLAGKFGDYIYKIFIEKSKKVDNIYPYKKTSIENIKLFLNSSFKDFKN